MGKSVSVSVARKTAAAAIAGGFEADARTSHRTYEASRRGSGKPHSGFQRPRSRSSRSVTQNAAARAPDRKPPIVEGPRPRAILRSPWGRSSLESA